VKNLALAIGLLLGAAQSASAAQIILSPANVVGSSGYNQSCCDFRPGNILDQQTGPVTESFGAGYWLNPDGGPADAYITIDLGAVTRLASVALYNGHNGSFGDRGTGQFAIYGSNSIAGGQLVGATLLVNGALTQELAGQSPLTAQSFSLSGSYRYISFNPITAQASSNGFFGPYVTCCGSNVYALNELRVFGGVPEPASWAMLMAGFGLIGTMSRRQRTVAA
jgi:hypothetical protein